MTERMGGDGFIQFSLLHIFFNKPDEVSMVDGSSILGEEEKLLPGIIGKLRTSMFDVFLYITAGYLS